MPIVIANPATPASWSNWDGTNDGADQTLLAGYFSDLTMVRVSPNIYALAYSDDNNGYKGTVVLLQVSGTTVTAGTKMSFTNDTGTWPAIAATGDFVDDNSSFIIGWSKNYAKVAVVDFSGTTINSIGTTNTLLSASGVGALTIERLENDKALAYYYSSFDPAPNDNFTTVLSVSGSTITNGTPDQWGRTSERYPEQSDNSDKIVVLSPTYAVVAGGTTHAFLEATPVTISGTSNTAGTSTIVDSDSTIGEDQVVVGLDGSRVYVGGANNSDNNYLYGSVFTSAGATVTPGSHSLLQSTNTKLAYGHDGLLVDTDLIMHAYKDTTAGDSKIGVVDISGTTINSMSTPVSFGSGQYLRLSPTTDPNVQLLVRMVYPNIVAKLINV